MTPTTSANQIDYKRFIKFHPSCNGTDGRSVYIDPQLLVRFAELIDPQSSSGLQVVQGIIGLKHSAAGVNSDSNQSNALQHRITLHNILVTYSLMQSGGRGPGVYVTNLQHGFSKDGDNPGLYKVLPRQSGPNRWAAVEDSSSTMPTSVGVLGAVPPSESQASGATMSANVFAETLLRKEGRTIGGGFSLFYTPTYAVDAMGVWLTAEQKNHQATTNYALKFAQLLAKTAKAPLNPADPEKFKWYIFGHGLKLFQQAFREYQILSTEPLGRRHEIYFVDPQGPVGLLQQELRDNRVAYHQDKTIITESMGLASRLHQLVDPSEGFANLYRSWTPFRNVNSALTEGKKIMAQSASSSVYFSDLIKQLGTTLINPNKRWH